MGRTADLSVIMPTHNHARFLPRALDALLGQSVRPKQLIVVNDASPDDTPAILDRYAQNDPVVQVIHNEGNRGVNESVRLGLERANGKYLFCASSDDYVLPGFIKKLTDALEQYPEAGLCSSYSSVVNGATGEIRPNPSGWCKAPRYFAPREVEQIVGHSSIPGHATIIKRSSFDAAGGLLADLEWHSDWFLTFVVAFRDGMCHVPEMLSLWREVPNSYVGKGMQSEKQHCVLSALLNLLSSEQYADVAPAFQRSGVLSALGLPVMVAAASRPDVWTKSTLSYLNSFTSEQYEELLDHPEPSVRDLAAFFLGSHWAEFKHARAREQDERRTLEQRIMAFELMLAETKQELTQARATTARTKQDLADHEQTMVRLQKTSSSAELEAARATQLLAERDARLRHLESTVERQLDAIRAMENSYYWKTRKILARCKRAILEPQNQARMAS